MSTVMKKAEELRLVPLNLIDTVVECRSVNQAHVDRLAESINEIGVEQPVVVYARGDRYTLGPGRHRYEACKKLGLLEIPAIVRPDAPDAQIRQAQMIENLQRENMTPMEEAQACEQLLEEVGGNIERVAILTGHNKRWVEQRISFNRLSPRVRQLVLDKTLPLEYAYYIARVTSHEKQEEIAGQVAADKSRGSEYDDGRPAPWWRLRNLVEQSMRTLKGVSWRLDVEFAEKPACNSCPNNSLNQPSLFADDKKKEAECLEPGCYAEKSKLAGSSLRKAVNYMSKSDLVASPKNAEAAIAAREVPFVDPKAVVSSAKSTVAPSKKTSAERRGRSSGDDDYKIESEFRSRYRNWSSDLDQKITAKLRKNKVAIAMFLLLKEIPEFDELDRFDDESDKKKSPKQVAVETTVLKLVDLLKAPSGDSLAKIASKIEMPDEFVSDRWPLPYTLHDSVRTKLCEIYEVERTDPPTLKQVKEELTKAAKPEANAEESQAPAAGKSPKKKPTKKKKKSGKK